jgi:hypothetical protein
LCGAPAAPAHAVSSIATDTFGFRASEAVAGNRQRARERLAGDFGVIISGSPVIGNFEFGSGVDYIRIPRRHEASEGDYRVST